MASAVAIGLRMGWRLLELLLDGVSQQLLDQDQANLETGGYLLNEQVATVRRPCSVPHALSGICPDCARLRSQSWTPANWFCRGRAAELGAGCDMCA